MSEKRKPTYDLDSVRTWAGSSKFAVTGTVTRTAAALGFGSSEMAAVIRTMQREHFDKSVTSFNNHREWQDVYHVPSDAGTLYIKFRADVVTEFLLLSFKEKDNG
ncbi:type II toxin-antitoxin system MqsR family toxin [Methylobacterium sp. WL120]|uniref:type II toxin-antitoxin system MqsR family toxin n=1 Tax=Methylobacterium sp. WL120 TaxID=2603887 RepID=UPI0011CBBB2C|nr:type II toxin-antitoxin system MqsR family toxin [Methylobacterium sp. WL120]TXM64012.1 type II toxin-antitoxin system MqsR family toxin [Methylobacterium sp. WL120]